MADIGMATVHVDQALTNYSVGYKFDGFITDKVLPTVRVTSESGIFYSDDYTELNPDGTGERAAGAGVNEIRFGLSTSSYLCQEYEKAYLLPNRIRNQADSTSGVVMNAVRKPQRNLMMLQERRTAALAAATSNVTTPTTNWDQSDATIEADVDIAKKAIHDAVGVEPNVLICDINVARNVVRQADIREILKYTGQNLLKSEVISIVQGLFDLRWAVSGAYYNSVNQGQTASLSPVWGTAVYLAYVDPSAGLLDPTWAKLFASQDYVVKRWTENGRNGEWFEVSHVVDERECLAAAIYKLDAVL